VCHTQARNPLFRESLDAIPQTGTFLLDVADGTFTSRSNLADLARLRAKHLMEESKGREAMDLLLDASLFLRDLADNGIGYDSGLALGSLDNLLNDVRTLILSSSLNRDDIKELARELEILDRAFPRHQDVIRNELACIGTSFLKGNYLAVGGVGSNPIPVIPSWRFGFSRRLMAADGFARMEPWFCRIADPAERAWMNESNLCTDVVRDVSDSPNPFERVLVPGYVGSERMSRTALTHLRLLRAAAFYRIEGKCPDLEDPYGGKLLIAETGNHIKIWSVGRNGKDDGGRGGWRGDELPKDMVNVDFVIEVER
jgi:hypothetical protein